MRQAVAEALYETRPDLLPSLVQALVETLCSGQVGPLQQVLLVQALAALHSSQSAILTWFDRSLDAPNWEVRMWATFRLSWMTPIVLEATFEKLRRLLDDPESASVRNAACVRSKSLCHTPRIYKMDQGNSLLLSSIEERVLLCQPCIDESETLLRSLSLPFALDERMYFHWLRELHID